MNRRRPKAIIFDLGSTILAVSAPNWQTRCERLLALSRPGAAVDLRELVTRAEAIDRQSRENRDRSPYEYTALALIRLLADEFSLSFHASLEEVEREVYFAGDESVPTPGADAMLESLRSMGIARAIISNHQFSGRLVSEHLAMLGIGRLFEFVMSSADYGIRKPNPLLFQLAARRLGVRPDESWYAGDTLEFDVEGARAAGMTPVWYRSDAPLIEAPAGVVVVRYWRELTAVVRTLAD